LRDFNESVAGANPPLTLLIAFSNQMALTTFPPHTGSVPVFLSYKTSLSILQSPEKKGETTAHVISRRSEVGRGFRGISAIFRSTKPAAVFPAVP